MATTTEHATAVKEKQDDERKARRQAPKAQEPIATVKAKRTPPKAKASPTSKAQTVRDYIAAHPDARDFEVAKATGITASYVWDIRTAMKRGAAQANDLS